MLKFLPKPAPFSTMRGVLETRALPPARAAEGEQSSNVLWALACLHADERHAQALSIQMGPAGITHLFLLTNYLQLLMHGQRDQPSAKITLRQEE